MCGGNHLFCCIPFDRVPDGAVEADISEKTEKSIRVSKPMQASLDVVAAGETLSLLPGQEIFCTVTLPEALPRIDRPSLSVQVTLDEKTVFSGTAAQLESFVPHQNGQYRYSFSDGDSYTLIAEIAFAPQIFWQESDVLLGEVLPLTCLLYTSFRGCGLHLALMSVRRTAWEGRPKSVRAT